MENSINKTDKVLNICIKVLKITAITLHVLFTIFLFYVMINNFLSDLEYIRNYPDEHVEGIGVTLVILMIFVGPIGYGIIILIDIIGLVLSIVNEKKKSGEKNVLFFAISTASVIPTYLLLVFAGMILMRIL